MAKYQMSMTKEKIKFFLGLSLMMSLFFYSFLRQHQLTGFEYAILLSLTVVVLVFDYVKVSQFLELAKESESAHSSHELAIRSALKTTLKSPLILKLVGAELLTLYYAFFANFDERNCIDSKYTKFSYAKSSNAHDVFLFVALSQLPFLPFVHIFIEYKKGAGPAWAITLLTLWSVVWYLAQVEAVKYRPIELNREKLKYRFGLLWSADIPLSKIKMARRIDVIETLDRNSHFLSPFGSKKNVMLEFEEPIQFSGPYMLKRRERSAAISLDAPSSFLRQLAVRGVATG